MNNKKEGLAVGWTNGRKDEWRDGQAEDGWKDGRTGGKTEGRTDRRAEGWMDGGTNR